MNKFKQLISNNPGYLVISTVIWEFFSYFGMQALLILYLTEKLKFSDDSSYAIYGAYTSLVFVTPIVGGWLADRWLGFKNSIILGCCLIILGHLCLTLNGMFTLYLGLSLLVIGVGFFKTNAICLVGRSFERNPAAKSTAFTIYYIGANIGATLGPIVCAYLATTYGWKAGFGAAAVGMAFGLMILWYGRAALTEFDNQPTKNNANRALLLCLAAIIPCTLGIAFIIEYDMAGYVLTAIGLIALVWAINIFRQGTAAQRKGLWFVFMLTLFGTLFWAFDQQGGSSISLFIERNVYKDGIPAAMFQSINPAIIIIFGLFTAWMWKRLSKAKICLGVLLRVLPGFVLLTAGFGLLFFGAAIASKAGQASMFWPVVGLSLIGMAELFIDPIILSELTQYAPKGSVGVLTGMYYLFVGAFANYLAAQIATLTAITPTAAKTITLAQEAVSYRDNFWKITLVGVAMILALLIMQQTWRWYTAKKTRSNCILLEEPV